MAVSWGIGWWACQDLNLGPHPYQLNAGNRCAHRRFPRSCPTVGAKGMRSISPLVCVLAHDLGTHRLDVVWPAMTLRGAWEGPAGWLAGPPTEAAADSVCGGGRVA